LVHLALVVAQFVVAWSPSSLASRELVGASQINRCNSKSS